MNTELNESFQQAMHDLVQAFKASYANGNKETFHITCLDRPTAVTIATNLHYAATGEIIPFSTDGKPSEKTEISIICNQMRGNAGGDNRKVIIAVSTILSGSHIDSWADHVSRFLDPRVRPVFVDRVREFSPDVEIGEDGSFSTSGAVTPDESQSYEYSLCHGCEKIKKTCDLKKCSRCFHVYFCDRECQKEGWDWHKQSCYAVPADLYTLKSNTALHEALNTELFQEYKALTYMARQLGMREGTFTKGRRLLYKAIVERIEKDPVHGELSAGVDLKNNEKLIREAGCVLNGERGLHDMKDVLVFHFIPKRYHSDINRIWNGIGEWVA